MTKRPKDEKDINIEKLKGINQKLRDKIKGLNKVVEEAIEKANQEKLTLKREEQKADPEYLIKVREKEI